MRIGFIIERASVVQTMGTVMKEAIDRGHKVITFHNYSQQNKKYNFPSISNFPKIYTLPVSYTSEKELLNLIEELSIDVIISPYFTKTFASIHKKLPKVKWVLLQHSFDTITEAEFLSIPDKVLFYSEEWINIAQSYAKTFNIPINFKSKSIGMPELDQIKLINPDQVRINWNIPKDKQVVLFLPFDYSPVENQFYTKYIFGMENRIISFLLSCIFFKPYYCDHIIKGYNDRNILKSIRQFCDNNNAFLLVKAKKDIPIKSYLYDAADKVIYDESYYPSSILKALSISSLCINFFSTTVTEAIPLNVPNVCILPRNDDIYTSMSMKFIYNNMFNKLFSLFGVTSIWTIPRFINKFSDSKLCDFVMDVDNQKKYIEKYLTSSFGASDRAIEEIEKLRGIDAARSSRSFKGSSLQ